MLGILKEMTPQEKAQDLIDKYQDNILSFLNDKMKKENAKRCALIAVDEILNTFGTLTNGARFYTGYDAIRYYNEVRKEIKLMQ